MCLSSVFQIGGEGLRENWLCAALGGLCGAGSWGFAFLGLAPGAHLEVQGALQMEL